MGQLDQIEAVAAEWLAREDRGLGVAEELALEEWLSQSTAHRVAYLRLKAVWHRADRLAALGRPAVVDQERRSWWWGRYPAMAAAALVVTLCAGAYYANLTGYAPWSGEVYATRIGQHQSVRLADGTKMELNTNTRLRQIMTRASRTVMLEQGEAYFEVTHDSSRPFVVYAGNRKITDIGTRFSVRRDGEKLEVIVAEGRVRVDSVDGSRPVELSAGAMAMAKSDGTLVSQKTAHDIDDRLGWRTGMLVLNQETLAAAAEEFNRYSGKRIVIVGAARDLRIGGQFRADNVEVFTSLLKEGFGLKIKDNGTEIIVSE
jgi:transmembrane sensor